MGQHLVSHRKVVLGELLFGHSAFLIEDFPGVRDSERDVLVVVRFGICLLGLRPCRVAWQWEGVILNFRMVTLVWMDSQ
jgi:hypothetical protein